MSYTHHIDFDADYWPLLKSMLDEHGQPEKVEATRQTWSGPGGGFIVSTKLSWHVADDTIELLFSPEGRDGKGNLRYVRLASVSYSAFGGPPYNCN
jgi:hypothetical protein